MNDRELSRRQLIRLGAGAVSIVGLGACQRRGASLGTADSSTTTATTPASTPTTSSRSATVPSATSPPVTSGLAPTGNRRLVMVQLNGGNDLLNSLPPLNGTYRDLRPTLAVPETDLVALPGVDDAALHPSLQPLVRFWDAGEMAIARGIGFDDPDRSHFVSMDRWWRADDLSAPGWLGKVLDGLDSEPDPLMATALGSRAPLLAGAIVQPTVIGSPRTFHFTGMEPKWLTGMGTGGEPDLIGAARHAWSRTVAAVTDFAALTEADQQADDDPPDREGGATISAGLAVAAQMLMSDIGTKYVVVSAGGFDTHADQSERQAALLTDLADGLVTFFDAIGKAGVGDDVMVVTTSEFGRRAAENGSGGSDHGAGGLSLVLGKGITGGMHGEVDLDNLLEGDVRPNIDPRSLYTLCLDWMGADAEEVLGRRFDQLNLLKA